MTTEVVPGHHVIDCGPSASDNVQVYGPTRGLVVLYTSRVGAEMTRRLTPGQARELASALSCVADRAESPDGL